MKKYLFLALLTFVLLPSCRREQVSRMYVRDVSFPNNIYLGDTVTINFTGYFPGACWEFDRFDSEEGAYMLEIYPYMRKIDNYCPPDSIPFEYSAKFFPGYDGNWTIVTYGADTTIVKYLNVRPNF